VDEGIAQIEKRPIAEVHIFKTAKCIFDFRFGAIAASCAYVSCLENVLILDNKERIRCCECEGTHHVEDIRAAFIHLGERLTLLGSPCIIYNVIYKIVTAVADELHHGLILVGR